MESSDSMAPSIRICINNWWRKWEASWQTAQKSKAVLFDRPQWQVKKKNHSDLILLRNMMEIDEFHPLI